MNDDDQQHGGTGGRPASRDDDRHERQGGGGRPAGKDQRNGDESGDRDSGDDEDGAPAARKRSLFKSPVFWIILLIVVVGGGIGGFFYYAHASQFESTDDAFVDAHIVRLAPEVAGTLKMVADLDNRHVKRGELLAVIESAGPDARLAEANAGITQAISDYRQSQAQVDAAIAQRAQALAQSRQPLADAERAAKDLARYEALLRLDPSAVARSQLDQARAQAQSTAAAAAAARKQVDTADAQIDVARRAVSGAKAQIDARRAVSDQARVTLNDLNLTAPVDGQVVNRSVNIGSYVGPGTQLMAIIPDKTWITANFKETQLTDMRIGQAVTIRIDAFPDVEFRGRVDSITRGSGQAFAILPPQNATGNYVKVVQRVPVRIVFVLGKDENGRTLPDPRNYPIGPGMSAVPTVKVR